MQIITAEQTARVAALNDAARARTSKNSRIVFTQGVRAHIAAIKPMRAISPDIMPLLMQLALLRQLRNATVDPDNDPYLEHDFGVIEFHGEKLFWKVDAYANDGQFSYASEAPWDENQTYRIVTLMLASEY